MLTDHIIFRGGVPLYGHEELAGMYRHAKRANMSESEEFDDEHATAGEGSEAGARQIKNPLGWVEQSVAVEDPGEKAEAFCVKDVYEPRTPAEHRAVKIALRAEELGFRVNGHGRSVSRYIKRTRGKRADAILRALGRCSVRRREERR